MNRFGDPCCRPSLTTARAVLHEPGRQEQASATHRTSVSPPVAPRAVICSDRRGPAEFGEIGALLEGERGALDAEPPRRAIGERDLGNVSGGPAAACRVRMKVKMDRERDVGAQPQAAARGLDPVDAEHAPARAAERERAPVQEPEAAHIAVVVGNDLEAAAMLLDAPSDAIRKADRRTADEFLEPFVADELGRRLLAEAQRVVARRRARDRRPVAVCRRRRAAVDEEKLASCAHLERQAPCVRLRRLLERRRRPRVQDENAVAPLEAHVIRRPGRGQHRARLIVVGEHRR